MDAKALLPFGIVGSMVCPLHAQTPTSIEYTGRVAVDGQNFTSTPAAPGFFKCILITGAGETIWSNDGTAGAPEGTSSNGSEPSGSAGPPPVPAAIELVEGSVSTPFAVKGQFTLRLGTGTTPPITPEVLTDSAGNVRPDVQLRVWFSADNATFQKLTPDVQFGAVPFAVWSARAETVRDRAITPEKVAGNTAVPIGGVIAWSGSVDSIPDQFRRCDGSPLSSAQYGDLFEIIGEAYGAVDGTTFNLPNLNQRFVRGASPEVEQAALLQAGAGSGISEGTAINVPQLPAHSHGVSDPKHRHTGTTRDGRVRAGVIRVTAGAGARNAENHMPGHNQTVHRDIPEGERGFPGSNHDHTFSSTTEGTGISVNSIGSGAPHSHGIENYLPAYQELFYIIRIR